MMRQARALYKEPFVDLVFENRHLLFGKYNDAEGITKDKKKEKWMEIHNNLESSEIHLVPSSKTWTCLRDVVWRNLVDNLKRKMERKKRSGSGSVQLNHVEKKVLGKYT